MPNTLVHFAAQGAASRSLWRRLDPRWIYLGCLLPDVPWIVRRVGASLGVPADAIDLRMYAMAQASLAGTLLLCGVFAALAAKPRLAFSVLGFNALVHLLLDACEMKWGNGVHLFAPFSWRMTTFDLISGEGVLIASLSVAGALLVAWEILAGGGQVELWTGEVVRATGAMPAHDARLSLSGTFLEPDLLRVDRFVEHRQHRD